MICCSSYGGIWKRGLQGLGLGLGLAKQILRPIELANEASKPQCPHAQEQTPRQSITGVQLQYGDTSILAVTFNVLPLPAWRAGSRLLPSPQFRMTEAIAALQQ